MAYVLFGHSVAPPANFEYLGSMSKDTALRIAIVLAILAGWIIVAVLRSGTAW